MYNRRVRWLVVLLCGCNQILGISGVTERDAAFYDAPLDARPMCPTDGSAPAFRPTFHQIPTAPHCRYASVAEDGTALALCGLSKSEPWIGTVTGGLAPMQLDPPIATLTWQMLRLAPEGDFAIAYVMTATAQPQVLALARNPGATTWTIEGSIPGLSTTTLLSISTPSRRTNGERHLVTIAPVSSAIQVFDYTGDHTTWTQVGTMYPLASTGVTTYYSPPSLTADGLRLVLDAGTSTTSGAFYLERTDPAQPFGAARFIDTVPTNGVLSPFMSNDCGTMYFDALETVFYVYQ